jgi:hypothetical protein
MWSFLYADYIDVKQMVVTATFADWTNVSGSISNTGVTFLVWPSHKSSSIPKSTSGNRQKQRVSSKPNSLLTKLEI